MISLQSYQFISDAWEAGVAEWCRRASGVALSGGRAWMIAASEGQANWIKRRLLCAGLSLFGVQFLDARALRNELCRRLGIDPPELGRETLDFLLRVRAEASDDADAVAIARHPGPCLSALDDLAAIGWLDHPKPPDGLLSPFLADSLPMLRESGFWTPQIDRTLRRLARQPSSRPEGQPPLTVCVLGWDASRWPLFDLLVAALGAAESAYAFFPSPRGDLNGLQQAWITDIEAEMGSEVTACPSSGFHSAQAALASRLEGSDLEPGDAPDAPKTEFLVGETWADTVALTRDFVARWLLDNKEDIPAHSKGKSEGSKGQGKKNRAKDEAEDCCESARLVILAPRRTSSAVALVRALGAAGIAVEDELGEIPEPSLPIQIQRAMLDYHLNESGLGPLLSLVELLNEHARRSTSVARVLRDVCPLEPVEVRRALGGAFADFQHHDARVLSTSDAFTRTPVARALRTLILHLGSWPEKIDWTEALQRWENCLDGLGLSAEILEPLWTKLRKLPVPEPVPTEAFFRHLSVIVGCVPARRSPEGSHRFARVVVTTLEGAAGQIWGGAVFLDSNEGAWPLYPSENPFLDDAERTRLNGQRAGNGNAPDADPCPHCGHLLTSAERAQLEQFQFYEILENCTGPLAFAGTARDPAEPGRELYPNEWALRCLVESERIPREGEKLLDRWRRAVRRVERAESPLSKAEHAHLSEIFVRRRDPELPFDGYCFNFEELTAPDELPWADEWSVRDLDAVWNRPATFALDQIFGAEPWRDGGRGLRRTESWMIGRLVHRWVQGALGASKIPREFGPYDWSRAQTSGLERARAQWETKLRSMLNNHTGDLPLWWQGVMRKTFWASRRCLETLAENAGDAAASWVCLDQTLHAELKTHAGPLRLQARNDVMLLDRASLQGAACQIIDIRTGGQSSLAAPTPAQMEQGRGLGPAATLFLALDAGVNIEKTSVGAVHPELGGASLLEGRDAPELTPVLERIARRQRSLVFGQRGPLVGASEREQTENLPLATTAIDPAVLEAKANRILD